MTDTALSLAFQAALDREAEQARQEAERLRQMKRGPSLAAHRRIRERSHIRELYAANTPVAIIALALKPQRSKRYVYRHLTAALAEAS